MSDRPLLTPGYQQNLNRDDIADRRWAAPLGHARSIVEDTARRVAESRKSFPWKLFRGDCHIHTQHSDGIGTVKESADMAKAAGLDFAFVTDHGGVTQRDECRELGLWYGQEPGAGNHHLGILGLDHAFIPGCADILEDFTEARRLGATAFIPHPAGWFPTKVYTEEVKNDLFRLPSPFLMEVINGAGNIVTAFDYTDAFAIEVWDRLLTSGRQVHAMGNTDAHTPHQVGIVWNGVFASKCDQASILKALSAGRSFASEAPLLNIAVGSTQMGGRLKSRAGASIRFTVADSRGLASVRLVADGKVRKTWLIDGDTVLKHERDLPASWKRYVRVEAIAVDGRRGFSNPVYLA